MGKAYDGQWPTCMHVYLYVLTNVYTHTACQRTRTHIYTCMHLLPPRHSLSHVRSRKQLVVCICARTHCLPTCMYSNLHKQVFTYRFSGRSTYVYICINLHVCIGIQVYRYTYIYKCMPHSSRQLAVRPGVALNLGIVTFGI